MSRPNDALEVIEMLDKSGPESYMNPLAQYDQLKDELRYVKAPTHTDFVPHGQWVLTVYRPNYEAKMDGGNENESD